MTTYISILRGINVSGQKIIKMDALKRMYEKLNFENVQTYVQSGNVIFSVKETDTKEIEKIISSQIEKEFGFDVPVIVLSAKILGTIIENNPFTKDNSKEPQFLHVTFLADNPIEFDKEKIVEKKQMQLPETIVNVEKCKNPRCITSVEKNLDQIFYLANRTKRIYRCKYCDSKIERSK